MRHTLNVGPDFELPLEWMPMSTVVFGTMGSGKTNFGVVLAEEAHKAGQRFCAIDIKGDWWGLRSSADGSSPGLPVVIFGGDHADVPLDPDAGALVGQLVAELPQSCILDLEHLSKGKQVRFLAAFFESLYHHNRDPLLMLCDEGQRYAPQKPMSPEATICLGAVEDAVKLGRKHGMFMVLFTQRGAGLNKEVSELCGCLVAFRTPGVLDQKRVTDWLEANATKAVADLVLENLAGLPTGTAAVASAHPDFKMADVKQVRKRTTFDSSATPKPGESRRAPRSLAPVDLEALRTRMAATIEKAKADDPRELRKQIAELQKHNRELQAQIGRLESDVHGKPQTVEVERVVEVSVVTDDDWVRLEAFAEGVQEATRLIAPTVARVKQMVDEGTSIAARILDANRGSRSNPLSTTDTHGRAPRRWKRPAGLDGKVGGSAAASPPSPLSHAGPEGNGAFRLSGSQQKILDALARLRTARIQSPSRTHVAAFAGVSPKSSGYEKERLHPEQCGPGGLSRPRPSSADRGWRA